MALNCRARDPELVAVRGCDFDPRAVPARGRRTARAMRRRGRRTARSITKLNAPKSRTPAPRNQTAWFLRVRLDAAPPRPGSIPPRRPAAQPSPPRTPTRNDSPPSRRVHAPSPHAARRIGSIGRRACSAALAITPVPSTRAT